MPSPVLPSEIQALISNANTPLCDAFKNVAVNFIPKFYEIYSYMFDSSGNLNPDFIADINAGADTVKPGTIIFFTGPVGSIPDGYVVANGAAFDGNQDAYADLWSIYGTMHGGSGIADFKVPNLIGSFLEGNNTAGQIGKLNGRIFMSLASGEFDGTTDTITEEYEDFFDTKTFTYYEGTTAGGAVLDTRQASVCYIKGFFNEPDGVLRITHNWGNSRVRVSIKMKVKFSDDLGAYSVNEEVDLSPGFYTISGTLVPAYDVQLDKFYVSSLSLAAPTQQNFPYGINGDQVFKSGLIPTFLNVVEKEDIVNLSVGVNEEYFSLPNSSGELVYEVGGLTHGAPIYNHNVRGNLVIELKRIATFENDYSELNSMKAIPLVKL